MQPANNIEFRATVKAQPPMNTKDIIIKSFSTFPGEYVFSVTCDVDGIPETFSTTFYDEYMHCGSVKIDKSNTSNALKFVSNKSDPKYIDFIQFLAKLIFHNSNGIHVEYKVNKPLSAEGETPTSNYTKELQMTIHVTNGSFMLRLN